MSESKDLFVGLADPAADQLHLGAWKQKQATGTFLVHPLSPVSDTLPRRCVWPG